MSTPIVRHRFTAVEYEQMVRAGILTDDDRVELIEGEIIEMSPIGEKHAACVNRLNEMLILKLSGRAIVAVQNPVRIGDESVPQPDVAVVKRRDDFYARNHPRPTDVLLVIEVADTSQEKDRDVKLPLYARAGIAEAWLIDLQKGTVEVCRKPARDGYSEVRTATRADQIAPSVFPDVEIAIDQILG